MNWLTRLFAISPMFVIYLFHETHHGMLHDRVSSVKWFVATAVCLVMVWMWDSLRKPHRTKPSVIITRMLITSMVVFSFVGFLMGKWYVWYIFSHSVVWMIIWLQLFIHRFAHHFVYPHDPSGTYYQVRRAGWHPFWDRLPRLFNPDPDMIRNGGIAQPSTAFTPPAHWQYQCPTCGARVEKMVDVCWNCNYGADGNSQAYVERWGNPGISNPVRRPHNTDSVINPNPPQSPPQVDVPSGCGPIDSR